MKESAHYSTRISEHGGAGAKLLIVAVVIVLFANAGLNFVPVAYQGENFKQDMQTAVVQGVSMPAVYGNPNDLVKEKIVNAARVNEVPATAFIEVKEKNKVISARVYYVKQIQMIPFGIWNYDFVFDYTATPGGFLTEAD